MQSLMRRFIKKIIFSTEGRTFLALMKLINVFRSTAPINISYHHGFYLVEDHDGKIAVSRKSRLGYQIYKGLQHRRERLLAEYGLPDLALNENDVVIDCGANIGEFSIACDRLGAKVLSFEPDRCEFQALEYNANGRNILPLQIALWNTNGSAEFFDRNDSGDSSLIASNGTDQGYLVETRRLDDIDEVPPGKIKLVKLEAEGAEPEILEGMKETLSRVDLIAVDMGPERGSENSNTVVECSEFLRGEGFRMVHFGHARCTAVFQRMQ